MRTLSSAEAAELLGVSPRHVAKLIRRGVLPGYPVMTRGGRVHAWRVTADGLDAYQRRLITSTPTSLARKGLPT